jgi:cytochrome P450
MSVVSEGFTESGVIGGPGRPVRLNRAFFADPHASYQRLHAVGPVHRATYRELPVWLVTGYAEARELLADARLSKDNNRALELFPEGISGSDASPLSAHMLTADPPDHTRLRKLVTRAFTARAISRLRPRIEAITEELLGGIAPGSQVDLVEALAFPLAITVICELLGIPDSDRGTFRVWTKAFVGDGSVDEIRQAREQLIGFLATLVTGKRAAPADDLLSELVRVRDEDDRLSQAELESMAYLLLVAGHETTVHLITNSMLALLRDPRQLVALRADPALLPRAIEEFLRFDGPVNIATVRFATDTIRVADAEIQPGEFVMIAVLAANRDGSRFARPDQLDVTGDGSGHLGFGHGIHYCLGAPLARLEAEVALGKLLSRFGTIELAADLATLRRRKSTMIHGLDTLPIRVGPLSAAAV